MLHDWLRFFYDWPGGAIWGNVVVVTVVAPLGWAWSKTRFWPIRPLEHAVQRLHTKLDAHHHRQDEHNEWMAQRINELHLLHTGNPADPHPHFALTKGENQ